MKDIIKKYKKHILISNIWIIAASLVMAVWVNFFIIDGTDIWQNLKANVLNPIETTQKADIFIEKKWNEFVLKNWKIMNSVVSFSFSFVYNWDNVGISNISSKYWKIINLQNENGINSIILNFDSPTDITQNSDITKFTLIKNNNEKTENLNIINANFKDKENESYLLSTSWITF